MIRQKKWLQLIIFAAILVVVVFTLGNSLLKHPEGSPKIGSTAPTFKLAGLDGQVYQLEDYRGSPLIVNFWGSFCPPCVSETPLLESEFQAYQKQGLNVIGINLNEPELTVRNFAQEHGVTYPVLLDDYTVRDQYGVRNYPTTFFIDTDGNVRSIHVGELKKDVLTDLITDLLDQSQE